MNGKICKHCQYFDMYEIAFEAYEAWGTCNRYPPVLYNPNITVRDIADEIAQQWKQPLVVSSDWCGEFKLKIVGASIPVAIEKSL